MEHDKGDYIIFQQFSLKFNQLIKLTKFCEYLCNTCSISMGVPVQFVKVPVKLKQYALSMLLYVIATARHCLSLFLAL